MRNANQQRLMVGGWLIATLAMAQEPQLSRVPELRAGAELGLLMRQEAGGQRTPLPALSLRLHHSELLGPVGLGMVYQFAFALEGTVVRSFTQHHRLQLRPEVELPLGTAFFSLGAGPGVQLFHSALSDSRGGYGSLVQRWCVGGELAFGVRLGRTRLRTGVDVTFAPGRWDLLIGLGAHFGLGEGS